VNISSALKEALKEAKNAKDILQPLQTSF